MKETIKVIHYPDLKFVKLCEEKYGINRGVFNVIDEWFYKEGFVDIMQRRRVILDYLVELSNSYAKMKFGPGGVKRTLEAYMDQQLQERIGGMMKNRETIINKR